MGGRDTGAVLVVRVEVAAYDDGIATLRLSEHAAARADERAARVGADPRDSHSRARRRDRDRCARRSSSIRNVLPRADPADRPRRHDQRRAAARRRRPALTSRELRAMRSRSSSSRRPARIRADQERRARELAQRHRTSNMNVTNLEPSSSASPTSTACRRFWTDFGLRESTGRRRRDASSAARTARRSCCAARTIPRCRQPIEPGSTQREAMFGVRSAADLDGDRQRSSSAIGHVRSDADGTSTRSTRSGSDRVPRRAAQAGHGAGAEVQYAGPARSHQHARPVLRRRRAARDDAHRVHDRRAGQDRAVLRGTARASSRATVIPGRGYFLRGGASHHHHNLFLLNVGKKPGFHHLAFELGSIHELFGGGLNMTKPRLAHGARPGPPPDLVVLLLVLPQPLRRRRGVRLRLRLVD